MSATLKIAAVQINTKVGDVAGNIQKIMARWKEAEAQGADLTVTQELSIPGYPLEDQVENPDLLDAVETGLAKLVEASRGMKSALVVGYVAKGAKDAEGRNIYNEAAVIENGAIIHHIRKQHLPNTDVFDEKRNFAVGPRTEPFAFRGMKLGLMICEDTWYPDVAADLANKGAQALISINGSPFYDTKHEFRRDQVVAKRAAETNLPILYVNQVGGQDEIVFDGCSMLIDADGALKYQGPAFRESLDLLTLSANAPGFAAHVAQGSVTPVPAHLERVWRALVTGTKDYCAKNRITDVVLGMSGGIDSAIVAAIAADALGGSHVHLVSMPYKFTGSDTRSDARTAAQMLGAPFEEIPIADALGGLQQTLGQHFNPAAHGVQDENAQARTRGQIIMYLSNKYGWLPLSTGNKSEMSVGYCTLYGDMNGGFNPLKDVPKLLVRALSTWRNANYLPDLLGPQGPVMPDTIIHRPPSAELAPNQTDEAALLPYDILDPLLHDYVEKDHRIAQIAKDTGVPAPKVEEMIAKVDIAEFKRRQACPGVKITERSFGRGRRFPISRPTTPSMLWDIGALAL